MDIPTELLQLLPLENKGGMLPLYLGNPLTRAEVDFFQSKRTGAENMTVSNLPRKIIIPLRRGDLDALHEIQYIIDCPNVVPYTREIIDIWFKFIDAALIPTRGDLTRRTPRTVEDTTRASTVLVSIQDYMARAADMSYSAGIFAVRTSNAGTPFDPRYQSHYFNRLSSNIGNVARWAAFIFETCERSKAVDTFIHCCSFIDRTLRCKKDRVLSAFRTDRHAADLLATLWLSKNNALVSFFGKTQPFPDEYVALVHSNELPTCELLKTMEKAMRDTEFAQTFLKNWWGDYGISAVGYGIDPPALLTRTLLSRLSQIHSALGSQSCSPETASGNLLNLQNLLHLISYALDTGASPDRGRDFRIALDNESYRPRSISCVALLSHQSYSNWKLSGPAVSPIQGTPVPVCCLHLVQVAFEEISRHAKSFVTGVRHLLRGGIFQVIGNAALTLYSYPSNSPANPKDIATASVLIRKILAASIFPPILREISRMLGGDVPYSDLTQEQIAAFSWVVTVETQLDPKHTLTWEDIEKAGFLRRYWSQILVLCEKYETREYLRGICDSISHTKNPSSMPSSDMPDISRICSGCKETIYCSKWCQEEDWSYRHRGACSSQRSVRSKRANLDGTYYPNKWRYWHNHFICELYEGKGLKDHASSQNVARATSLDPHTSWLYIPLDNYDLPPIPSDPSCHTTCEFLEWARSIKNDEEVEERQVNGQKVVFTTRHRLVELPLSLGQRAMLLTFKMRVVHTKTDVGEEAILTNVMESAVRVI